jgi:O-antigen/teichoic acid export membrane protein
VRFLSDKFKLFFASEALRNSTFLLTGTVVSQLVGVLFMPLITRLYSPSDFGIFTSFNSILILISHLSNAKYAQAIVLPKEEREARVLVSLSSGINLLFTILLLFFWGILWYFGVQEKNLSWLFFIPFALFFACQTEVNMSFLTRIKAFKAISITRVLQTCLNIVFSVFWSLSSVFLHFGLILGIITSQIGTALFTHRKVFSGIKFNWVGSSEEIKEIAKKYKKFPFFGIPGAFVDSFAQQLPVYYLLYLSDTTVSGFYGLAVRVVQIPGILVAGSLNSVLLQKMSEKQANGENIRPLLIKTSAIIGMIVSPFLLLFLMFGPVLFSVFFGDMWRESGQYAKILFFIFAIRIIVSPITSIFSVKNKLQISFLWQICYFILGILFFTSMYLLKYSFDQVLICFAFFEFIMYSIYFFISLSIAK